MATQTAKVCGTSATPRDSSRTRFEVARPARRCRHGITAPPPSPSPGSNARFSFPSGVTVSTVTGTVYVADYMNYVVRAITPGGFVSTLAGGGGYAGLGVGAVVDGVGSNANFLGPVGLAIDGFDNVYVVSSSTVVQVINTSAMVTVIAGLPPPTAAGAMVGLGASCVRHPQHAACVRPPSRPSCCYTQRANPPPPFFPGSAALFNQPYSLATMVVGNTLDLADGGNKCALRAPLSTTGTTTTEQ